MRPSKHETFLNIARVIAERGTCARRKVGCVLVNSFGHIIGTGYNGNARGLPHCIDIPCPGANKASGSNTSLYLCEAIHAEQNALLQCSDVSKIEAAYCTTSPCIQCAKLLLQTSCKRILFIEPSSHEAEVKEFWYRARPDYVYSHMSAPKYGPYGLDNKELTWEQI